MDQQLLSRTLTSILERDRLLYRSVQREYIGYADAGDGDFDSLADFDTLDDL